MEDWSASKAQFMIKHSCAGRSLPPVLEKLFFLFFRMEKRGGGAVHALLTQRRPCLR